MFRFSLLFFLFFYADAAVAQSSPLKRADAISVKSTIESMLVNRYSQELSSLVSKEHFSIGARLDLRVVKEKKRNSGADTGFSDLDLGYLDADALFESYSIPNIAGVSSFEKYAIRAAEIQVGLQPNVGEEIKKSVEDWVSKRVKKEFGSTGKYKVQYIQSPNFAPKTQKQNLMQILQDLQGLFGQLVIAIAILLGVILWRLLMGGASKEEATAAGAAQSINIENKTEAAERALGAGGVDENVSAVEKGLLEQIDHVSEQIKELSPKIVSQLESLVEEWCDQGEEGLFHLACFAEISGSVLGSLPIPKDSKKHMSGIFSRMNEVTTEIRLDMVNRIYWDIISVLNLGTESLHRPFSFIASSALSTVNNVLLGNDADTQTVVTLYMPDSMRKSYFKGLDQEKKMEILSSAAKLSTISEDGLQNIEDKIAPYFGEKQLESEVSMSLTLTKLIDSMSFIDACHTLPSVEGPVIEQFKQKNAHIAFLSQWSKEALNIIVKQASNDELLAYLRVMPDMKHFVLEFVSSRAQMILEDDLNQPDVLSENDKEELLGSFQQLITRLVSSGELSLDEILKTDDNISDEELDIAA